MHPPLSRNENHEEWNRDELEYYLVGPPLTIKPDANARTDEDDDSNDVVIQVFIHIYII